MKHLDNNATQPDPPSTDLPKTYSTGVKQRIEDIELLSYHKLRDRVLEVYRPLFDPKINAEYMAHLLGVCTQEIDQIRDELKLAVADLLIDERIAECNLHKKQNTGLKHCNNKYLTTRIKDLRRR
jgi:hypothetical protein